MILDAVTLKAFALPSGAARRFIYLLMREQVRSIAVNENGLPSFQLEARL